MPFHTKRIDMPFVINDIIPPKNGGFDVFFIDAKGHVLNDRQVI